MLLHNRSSSAIVSLLTGWLLKEPCLVCVVYQARHQNREVLVFFRLLFKSSPNVPLVLSLPTPIVGFPLGNKDSDWPC